MTRRRLFAFGLAVLLMVGNFTAYWYLSQQITETMREPGSGEDRALGERLLLQVLVLGDLAVLLGLVVVLAGWGRRLQSLDKLRGDYADVRKALEMERQLAEADQRVHLMFETAAGGVLLLGDGGAVLLANRSARTLLGLERRGTESLKFGDLLAPQARVRFPELQRALREEGSQSLTIPVLRPDGDTVDLVVDLTPFEGPQNEEMVSLFIRPAETLSEPEAAMETTINSVLVVDDEELIRMLAKNMLVRLGLHPLVAASGGEGLELFRAHHDELAAVILDVIMPGQDGRSVAREMRAIDGAVPIIFCSGFSEGESAGSGGGQEPLLPKPFGLDEFTRVVRKYRR